MRSIDINEKKELSDTEAAALDRAGGTLGAGRQIEGPEG